MLHATTSIYLDTRTRRKNGTYAVKLRVTFNRRQKYYPTGTALSNEDWAKVQSSNPKGAFKQHALRFSRIEEHAVSIISGINGFTFQKFEKVYLHRPEEKLNVSSSYEHYMARLEKDGRIKYRNNFACALKSLESYSTSLTKGPIQFESVTVDWVMGYEKWMVNKGNSLTTVGIYLRTLRYIFNEAVEKGATGTDNYPFGRRKYQIPAGSNKKKALSIESVRAIRQYKPKGLLEAKSKDFWVLSYLCNGMNIKDMAELRFKDIDGGQLTFLRSKTKKTSIGNSQPIKVLLLPEAVDLINKHARKNNAANNFVFEIIEMTDSPERRVQKIQQEIKNINSRMKKICKELGIKEKVTTYWARHSYATRLKHLGASVELIRESLGHKDSKTTQSYLSSFDDDVKATFQAGLL